MMIVTNPTFRVVDASYEEAEAIVTEPQIAERIYAVHGAAPVVPECRKLILWSKYRMLVDYKVLKTSEGMDGIVHAHIAVPKASLSACRVLALLASYWVLCVAEPDTVAVAVIMPEGKMSNMALRLGYTRHAIAGKVCYVLSKLQAKATFDVLGITLID